MKIDLETSKKGNNFLGKEEVGSSNLLVGSIYTKTFEKSIFFIISTWVPERVPILISGKFSTIFLINRF